MVKLTDKSQWLEDILATVIHWWRQPCIVCKVATYVTLGHIQITPSREYQGSPFIPALAEGVTSFMKEYNNNNILYVAEASCLAIWLGQTTAHAIFCSLFVHNGPPTCLCVPESVSISSWALNHLSQLVLIMTTLTTCDDIMNNLSTFSQLVLIMIHSCLLSLFSCRLHGTLQLWYWVHHQCVNFVITCINITC